MKRGKKYLENLKKYDRALQYDRDEAIRIAKDNASAKFDETMELHIRTGCDGRKADQQIRGSVVLPNGTGKKVRILVFAKGPKADEALAAGADYVGAEELIPRIQNDGWFDYDVVVNASDITTKLPASPQKGQVYRIWKHATGNLTIQSQGPKIIPLGESTSGTTYSVPFDNHSLFEIVYSGVDYILKQYT